MTKRIHAAIRRTHIRLRNSTSRQAVGVKRHRNGHTRQSGHVQPFTSSKTFHVLDFSASIPIQPSRALWATDGLDGDLLEAVIAALLGDFSFGVTADLVDLDDDEDTGGDDEEVEDGLDKVSPVPGDAVV